MDVSLLRLKSIFRDAAGTKGTLLAQALRKRRAQHADNSPRETAGLRPLVRAETVKDPEKTT
jgi:hypothetical protein